MKKKYFLPRTTRTGSNDMKRVVFIVLILLVMCAFTAQAQASGKKSKGPESELVITVTYSTDDFIWKDQFSVEVTDEAGKRVFPGKKEKINKKGTYTVPLKNGKYKIWAYSNTDRSITVDLNQNQARVSVDNTPENKLTATVNLISVAKMDVITQKAGGKSKGMIAEIEASAKKAFEEINLTLPAVLKPKATIAVFPVSAALFDHAEMALENLTIQFVNAGYTVVEKRLVEELLAEYDFQMSGLVGQKTLGELLGADAVIFSVLSDDGKLSSWAVDTSKRSTLAKSENRAVNTNGNLIILPITNGVNNEAQTIASFLVNSRQLNTQYSVSDQSANKELMQYAGLLSSISRNKRDEVKGNAEAVIAGTVVKIGRKNMLILSGQVGRNLTTASFEYADSLELWVKLQYAVNKILTTREPSASPNNANIWSRFGAGVNRTEAEMLTQLLIADAVSVPVKTNHFRIINDVTRNVEELVASMEKHPNPAARTAQHWDLIRQKKPEKEFDKISMQLHNDGVAPITSFSSIYEAILFDWTRTANNRMRLEASYDVKYADGKRNTKRYVVEYGSVQEFLKKMRGLSIFIWETKAIRDFEILGYEGYNLSTVLVPAPVLANFIKFKRIQGGVSDSFYISKTLVSQREFESIMKMNPSRVKNPNQPVNNVSIIDAMIYCNQLSIRNGLEPAYVIEREINLKESTALSARERERTSDTNISGVSVDNFASGYRLAASNEWNYVANLVNKNQGMNYGFTMGISDAEYIYDGKLSITAIAHEDMEGINNIPLERGSVEFLSGLKRSYYEILEQKDNNIYKKVRVTPVFRLVRPIFDYWKYGGTGINRN